MTKTDQLKQQLTDNYAAAKETLAAMKDFSERQTALSLEFTDAVLRQAYPGVEIIPAVVVTQINGRQSPPTTEKQVNQLRELADQPGFPGIDMILRNESEGTYLLCSKQKQ